MKYLVATVLVAMLLAGCASQRANTRALNELPGIDKFCSIAGMRGWLDV